MLHIAAMHVRTRCTNTLHDKRLATAASSAQFGLDDSACMNVELCKGLWQCTVTEMPWVTLTQCQCIEMMYGCSRTHLPLVMPAAGLKHPTPVLPIPIYASGIKPACKILTTNQMQSSFRQGLTTPTHQQRQAEHVHYPRQYFECSCNVSGHLL